MYNLIDSILIGASLLEPFMPETAKKIADSLNAPLRTMDQVSTMGTYPSGNKVTDQPQILFAPKEEITYEDFSKMQFQVGEIISCEAVKKSKKLLCSQVKIGSQVKQIVSGIKAHYTPEEMVGKKVMVLVNLKPAKLAGVLSEGMLLCAEDADGNLALMTPEKKMPAGAEIC